MVARLERDKTLDRRAGKVVTNPQDDTEKSAKEAAARIEQFRRLTAKEIQATLEDSGVQNQRRESQQIRYSARVQVASAISRETFILQRNLAAIIDRTQDIEIKKLLKALHQRYLCLDIRELGESGTYIEELIEKTNAYLTRIASTARTNFNPIIHLRNGYVLVGPIERYELVHVVDNEETRKTMHYTGVKIAKPVPVSTSAPVFTQAQAKDSPEAPKEVAPEKGSYLKCVRDNRDKFKGKRSDINYRIAEGIAQSVDQPGSAPRDEDGTTIHELEKELKIADHKIAARLKTIGRIFQRMGITLDIEETITDADEQEAEAEGDQNENYFYRINLFWTASLESDSGGYEPVEKEGEDGNSDKDGDDEDEFRRGSVRGKTPSRGNAEYLKRKEDPNDIFPAFRGVKFTTAKQFNDMIVEIFTGDNGICTYERDASREDARKLMRSINACEVEDSIKDRVEEWRRRLSLGMQRFKKYGCLYRGAITGLLRGINVNDDET